MRGEDYVRALSQTSPPHPETRVSKGAGLKRKFQKPVSSRHPRHFSGPTDAWAAGITAIHQETVMFDELSVTENIFMGHMPTRFGRIDWPKMHEEAASLLARLDADFSPHTFDVTTADLVKLMVGRSIDQVFPKKDVPIGDVVLEVEDLANPTEFDGASFTLRAGEILGFYGLVGAGRSELMQALFGLTPTTRGTIKVHGKTVELASPSDAIAAGIAYVPEDRQVQGTFQPFGLRENTTLASLAQHATHGIISYAAELATTKKLGQRLSVKAASWEQRLGKLMQQIFAKRELLLGLIVAALILGVGLRAPVFLTPSSLMNVITDTSFLFMLTLAQMAVILTRGIDLSVAANLALTGMIVALTSRAMPGLPIAGIMALAIVIGAALGAINGVLIALVGIPPIVVTLGTLAIFRGAIFMIAGGAWLTSKDMNETFLSFPRATLFGIPSLIWPDMSQTQRYHVLDRPPASLAAFFMRWEVILVGLLMVVIAVNTAISPYFLDLYNISDATFNFSEKAILALAMALLIIAREIDLSVAAIVAVCSLTMGLLAKAGYGPAPLMLAGLLVGAACGAVNGALVTIFSLPSIVVTIGTMSLFRGLAQVVLGDQALTKYPANFSALGQGYISDRFPIPNSFVIFLLLALIFGFVLHRTIIGRRIFAIGHNPTAARFSGVKVNRIRFGLFVLIGIMAGLAAILLTGRIGSTRPNIAQGWELEIVTMVILGGVSISGGSGTILGVVLSVLVLGLTTFGLSLINVPGIVISILIGADMTQAAETERYAFKMFLHTGMEAEYKRRHDEIWPELVTLLKEAGVSNYSIHLDADTNILFAYLERAKSHSMDALPDHPVMRRWWDHMKDLMQTHGNIIDIGKTNVKLALFDVQGDVLWQKSQPNTPILTGLYPHADVERIWAFLLDALREANARHKIDVIVPTTHGATGALLDDNGLVLPIMDYEFLRLDEIERLYAPLRPPFGLSYSPRLPTGLNLGRQIAWQAWAHPETFATAKYFLTYPQYWLWRLTGALASDVTSLGCHTDLWLPNAACPSSLADALGLSKRMPPLLPSWAEAGTLKAELAAQTGLEAVPVLCGIHDSNAALLPYLRTRAAPFTVLSTGTWVVLMSVGHPLDNLRAEDDMMANVDATGRPIACARFMGGREYAEISGDCAAPPSVAAIEQLIAESIFALPSFSPHGGPYAARQGKITKTLQPDSRTSLATLYCALMSDHILTRLGVTHGDIIIDGSFAKNALFCELLAQLRPGQQVLCASDQAGTARGAAMLVDWPKSEIEVGTRIIAASNIPSLLTYRDAWLAQID
eukprot:gene12740-12836_t